MVWEINLQNPAWLQVVMEKYLSMGVVPAEGPPPALLTEGTARLALPDGTTFEAKGRVIRISGPAAFLVQIDKVPDSTALKLMIRSAKSHPATGAEAVAAAGVPASSALVDDLMSTVKPEHLLFQEVLDPEPRVAPSEPEEIRWPGMALPGGTAKSGERPPPKPAASTVSVQDLLGEAIEVESPRPLVPPPPKTLVQSQQKTALPSRPPPGPTPAPQHAFARAGTPGSVHDLPPGPREPGTPGGGRSGSSTVTGKETEYSDVYAKVKDLPLGEKQKLARHGRRTVRQILMRDPTKTLQRICLSNPDIALDEVLEYANWPGLAKDALEYIAGNTTWTGSRMVLLALVKNPSTPVELAIRLVARLGPAEWRLLVRPNLVRTPVANAARKALSTVSE